MWLPGACASTVADGRLFQEAEECYQEAKIQRLKTAHWVCEK